MLTPICLVAPPLAGREAAALKLAARFSKGEREALRKRYLDAAVVDRSGGLRTTGVRWWLKYVTLGRGKAPFTRLTATSSFQDKLEAEELLMDFALWLALCKPSGRQISARTIKKYISQVRAWHLRQYRTHLCGDLDYSAINDLMKGVCRLIQQPAKRVRYGVRTQHLSAAIARHLSGASPDDANWAAALSVGFCGLMRAAEFSLQPGEKFNPLMHLTRADVSFRRTAAGLKYVIIMMRPAKLKPGRGKDVPLLLAGGGTLLDPVAALERLWTLDPVPEDQLASTPLFRTAKSGEMRVSQVRGMVKLLMSMLGLDPAKFGAHSLRIGGATAGLAGKLSEHTLRAAGRWQGDAMSLYTRASKEAMMSIATIVGSTAFEDIERGEFVDEELMVTSKDLQARGGIYDTFVGDDLVADAIAGDDESEEDEA